MRKTVVTTLIAAAMLAAPALHAQGTTGNPQVSAQARVGARFRGGRPGARMAQELGLTATQQAQIKAIHQKYAPQMKQAREAARPQMQSAMTQVTSVRRQEQAEIRGVLTPAQQVKFDSLAKARRAAWGARGNRAGNRTGATQ